MRYGIVSDVHANIQAWKAVLRDMRNEGVDTILCLGDVVGYGPNPAEVLESCYQHVDYFILGNHDAVIGDRLNSSLFNDNAKYLIEWTRDQLNDSAAQFFSEMPLQMEGDGFTCAHAELAMPGRFNYIYEAQDAIESFTSTTSPVMFVGHTHFPAKFRYDLNTNLVHQDLCTNGYLQANERYLINVGSVGDPRDGNVTASYCIYDADTGYLEYKQVPFDLKAFRKNLLRAKLPIKPYFISVYEGAKKEGQTIKDMAVMEGSEAAETSSNVQRIKSGADVKTSRQKVTFSLDDVRSSKKSKEEKKRRKKSEEEAKKKGLKIFLTLLLVLSLGGGGFLLWHKLKTDSENRKHDELAKKAPVQKKKDEQPVLVQRKNEDLYLALADMKKPAEARIENGTLKNWRSDSEKLSWKVRIKEMGWYRVLVDHDKEQGAAQIEVKLGPTSIAGTLRKFKGEQELFTFENANVGDMNFSISLAAASEEDVTSLKGVRLQFLGLEKPFDFDKKRLHLGGFESGTYQGWISTGPAFGDFPMTEEGLPAGVEVKGIRNKYFAASLALGNTGRGTLQTPPFTVRHKVLAILAAGGKDCSINVYVEGQLAETHKFSTFSNLKKIFFDMSSYAGKTAFVKFIDAGSEYLVFDNVTLLSTEPGTFKPGPSVNVTGKKKAAEVNELNKFLSKAGAKLIKKNFKGCLSDLEEATFVTGVNLDNYKTAVSEIADFEQFFINTFKKDLKKKTTIIPKGTGLEKTVLVEGIQDKRVQVVVDGSATSTPLGIMHISEKGIKQRVAQFPAGLLAYHIHKEDIRDKIKSIRYSSKNPIAILVNAATGGLKVNYPKGSVVGSKIEIWPLASSAQVEWDLSLKSGAKDALLEKPEKLSIKDVYPGYKAKGMTKKYFDIYQYDLTTETLIKELSFSNSKGQLNSMVLLIRNSQGQIVWQRSFHENANTKKDILKGGPIKFYSKEAPPQWENLALGKPSTASDPHSGGYVGVNDGIWAFSQPFLFGSSKKDNFPKYVTVDLESVKKVNVLRFGIPNRGSTKNISLQYSLDNNEFKTLTDFEFTQGITERYTAYFEPFEARYLRIRFNENYEKSLNRAANTHVFISEFEAYFFD